MIQLDVDMVQLEVEELEEDTEVTEAGKQVKETGDGSKKDSSCGWCDRCGTAGGVSGSVPGERQERDVYKRQLHIRMHIDSHRCTHIGMPQYFTQ